MIKTYQILFILFLIIPLFYVLQKPTFSFPKTKFISGKTLREKYPKLSWVYWLTHTTLIFIVGLYLLTLWSLRNNIDFKITIFLISLVPVTIIINAIIARISGVYPLHRFRDSTVFYVDKDLTKQIANKQIMASIFILICIAIAFVYL